MQIGAQLYTVRQYTQNLDDLAATLKKVAQMGYTSVQISGVCPFEPEWMRDQLQENGLVCAMTHTNSVRLREETEAVVKEHAIYGCRNIGIGGIPGPWRSSIEGYEEFRKAFLPVALKLRDLGAKFQYHNHWFEFDKVYGKNVIERMMEDFPEDSVDFTLDLGWAAYAGNDVVKMIENLSGRISRIHLKDYLDKPEDSDMATVVHLRPIYEGKLPYDDYFAALKKAGCEYALVEQDHCYEEDSMDCLERSLRNIQARNIL